MQSFNQPKMIFICSCFIFQVYKINNIEGDDEEEPVQSQITPVFDSLGQVKLKLRMFFTG